MELLQTVAVSTRIRLARNFAEYPFPHRLKDKEAVETIIHTVSEALNRADDFKLYRMDAVPMDEAERFMENYLISPALIERRDISAVLINSDENLSIMINEEDHLREQCSCKGYDLSGCYEILAGLDDRLSKSIAFAYDEQLGYLTACPTNLGTGMRASVMLFLPGLIENGLLPAVGEQMERLGFTLRGVNGEGSASLGALCQLSNEVTLGMSENEILHEVNNVVLKIVQLEGEERRNLFLTDGPQVRDRALRAYGVLRNCALLEYEEFMTLLADVKLGVTLGILEADLSQLDDLAVAMRNANLKARIKMPLTELELASCRAKYAESAAEKLIVRKEA